MRRQLILVLAVTLLAGLFWAAAAFADESRDTSIFYDQLAPYGTWMDNPRYGQVWQPGNLPEGWRPYSDGRWVYTDEGMTWVSDQDWGWITFHYGRWFDDPVSGWLWVPGTVWSPGWVAWREGPGMVGWAALPPDYGWEPWYGGVGLAFAFDDIGFFWWNFVDDDELFEHHFHDRFRHFDRDDRFFRDTRNVTHFRFDRGRAIDDSFNDEHLGRLVGHRVDRVNLGALNERREGVREFRDNGFRPEGGNATMGIENRRGLAPGGIERGFRGPGVSTVNPGRERPMINNPGRSMGPERGGHRLMFYQPQPQGGSGNPGSGRSPGFFGRIFGGGSVRQHAAGGFTSHGGGFVSHSRGGFSGSAHSSIAHSGGSGGGRRFN